MELDGVVFTLLDKNDEHVIRECALLMSKSEPWLTLRRTYHDVIDIIEDDTSEVYLAQPRNQQHQIIGFAIIKLRGAFVGYVQSIIIKPQFRNQGLGRAFMKFLEKRIFSEHCNVFVCVSAFNPGAKKLYENLGYEIVGELKDYIVRGHSEILMRKSRAPLSECKTERDD